MEEDNINEHKNYLTLEEEKRKKARLVRETVEGPLIRWVSKQEKVTVLVEPPRPPPSLQPLLNPVTPATANPAYLYAYYPSAPIPSSTSASPYRTTSSPYHIAPQNVQQASAPYLQLMPPPPPLASDLVEEEQTVTKNYVVHEVDQSEGAPRPLWKQTMGAMFGDHVNWEEAKVYAGRNRPLCVFLFCSHSVIQKLNKHRISSSTRSSVSDYRPTRAILGSQDQCSVRERPRVQDVDTTPWP